MKQYLVSVLLACGALLLFWALFLPKPAASGDRAARPLSFESAPEGYSAITRWLEQEDVRAVSLRRRFDDLASARLDLPPTGNLLVVTLPETTAVRDREFDAVDAWVTAGNTLFVIAGLDDTPAWDRQSEPRMPERFARLVHVDVQTVKEGVDRSLVNALRPSAPRLVPVAEHPVNAGVQALATREGGPASQWSVSPADAAAVLVLARREDTGRPALWLRPQGEGAIVVSAWASPFANAGIGEADNARWFAQLVGWALGTDGAVVFDDAHQGASDYYDPQAFYRDPRLLHSLAWLAALWFAWVLGARVLRPAPAEKPPLDDTAMLRVTGGFLAHVLRPADGAMELFRHFFNSLRRRLSQPENGEPLWGWLAAQARVDVATVERLRALHDRARAGRRVDLVTLRNLLHDITGRLA